MRIRRFSDWQLLDRWVAGITCCSLILIVGMLSLVNQIPPHVRSFNWQDQTIQASERQLILSFNRLMDPASVAANLSFDPPLPGRSNWVGRRWIYFLDHPAPYGQTFHIRLDGAVDRQGRSMQQPFEGTFQTPDPQLLTIGVEGEWVGRLIGINLATQTQIPLTDPGLKVTRFAATADGDTVYYMATATTQQQQDLYQLSLRRRRSKLLLDHDSWQNLRFEVSSDGEVVIVERINPTALGQIQLWIKRSGQRRFRPLELELGVGGDFLITPDHRSVLMSQGQGVAILSLDPEAEPDSNRSNPSRPADPATASDPAQTSGESAPSTDPPPPPPPTSGAAEYFAQYGQALAIKPDGSAAAMISFQTDYTRTLSILSNTGRSFPILTTQGSILAGQFAPAASVFYCLTTRPDPVTFSESPSLLAIDWVTGVTQELIQVQFPNELDFEVSPDGRQVAATILTPSQGIPDPKAPVSQVGQSIAKGTLQLMLLDHDRVHPAAVSPDQNAQTWSGASVGWIP